MSTDILERIQLRQGGGGGDPKDGLCVMELVSWLAGDNEVTDRPSSACPVLTSLAIALNDTAPSAKTRNALRALAPAMVGSFSAEATKARDAFVLRAIVDDLVAPRLEKAGFAGHGRALREARGGEAITAAARAARIVAPDGTAAELVACLTSSDGSGRDAAENVLLHLNVCLRHTSAGRERLVLWRAMCSILERAIALGPQGSLREPQQRRRLDELHALLWPNEPAPAQRKSALPAWLEALVHGPAGAPDLAPAPSAKRELVDA